MFLILVVVIAFISLSFSLGMIIESLICGPKIVEAKDLNHAFNSLSKLDGSICHRCGSEIVLKEETILYSEKHGRFVDKYILRCGCLENWAVIFPDLRLPISEDIEGEQSQESKDAGTVLRDLEDKLNSDYEDGL